MSDSETTLGRIITAFDELDNSERPSFLSPEDRDWLWAAKKEGRKEYYEVFNGISDVIAWVRSTVGAERGGYLPDSIEAPQVELSRKFDYSTLPELTKDISLSDYDRFVGRWNAGDYILANAYCLPERLKPKVVLDFGAGYGRQVNLWSQNHPGLAFISMDAIRKPYLAQAAYYLRSRLNFREYCLSPSDFVFDKSPGIWHLPSWRWDLVPEASVDMVLAIFVLPELHASTLHRTLEQFARVVKPGGAVYIRDHGLAIKSANTEDVAQAMQKLGFVLEFRPYIQPQLSEKDTKADIRGVPRIWRRRIPGLSPVDEA